MNRELKLALIVGFALVLVVTVLISDHLSSGRGQKLASEVPESPALITAAPPAPAEREAAFIRHDAPVTQPDPQPSPTGPLAMGDPQAGTSQLPSQAEPAPLTQPGAGGPVVINQGRDVTPGVDHPQGDSSLRDVVSRMGGRIENGTIYLQPQSQPTPGNGPAPTPAGSNGSNPTQLPPTQPPSPQPQPRPAGPSSVVEPAAPAITEYTVVEGDNLFKIARKFLGDGKQWRRIADANASIAKGGQVKVGQKIKIPIARAAADPRPVPSNPRQAAAPTPREANNAPTPGSRTYMIRKGDTLGTIAWHELGTMKRSGEILAMNKGVITDEDNVPLGAVIKLPAR